MAHITEPLSGGVVTSKDPSLLQPGQLSDARNCYYVPGTQALTRARGRTLFASASAGAVNVVGLRDAKFDNGNHYLIAHASSSYLTAVVGTTGTFASLFASAGNGSQLESAHYRNRFYLFNGTTLDATATNPNTNRVIYLSATATGTALTVRQHGMLPVKQTAATASAGTFSQTVTGYYEYWATEVAKFQQDGSDFVMESTFTGDPTTVFVSSTGIAPVIEKPQIRNELTTHWRVYRSPKKDKEKDKLFPSGFMIGEVGVAATSITDTLTVASATSFPASFNGVSPDTATFNADFTNAARLSADDNSDATAQSTALIDFKNQGVFGFNFGGFTGPVRGIKVEVEALVNTGTSTVGVTLARKRQADGGIIPTNTPPMLRGPIGELNRKLNTATKAFTATTARVLYTLGGDNDRWFPQDNPLPLVDTDFGTDFMVIVGFSDSTTTTLSVDYVKVTVYYGGTLDSVTPFPTVVYTFGDITAQIGKNGPPPSSSTGDFYEDSLVVNDVTNPALIYYSYPGDPEAFPGLYYIDFETKDNDQVRLIKVVNEQLVVALDSSIWRVKYLPSERDASFDRGKAKEPISRSYGCVGPMLACTFSPDGGSELMAFVSHHGIHSTDGFSFNDLIPQLKWRNLISLTSTSRAIALIDDAEKKLLRLFFRNDTSTYGNETYLMLPLSYAPEHMGDRMLKAGGLVHVRNYDSGAGGTYASVESAWAVPRSNGDTSIYLGYGGSSTAAGAGKVYLESGSTIPSNDAAMQYTTRRMFLSGFGSEWKLGDLYGYVSQQTGAQTFRYSPFTVKTNDTTGEVTAGTKSVVASAAQLLHKVPFNIGAEGLKLTFAVTSGHDDLAKEFLVIDGEDFGVEDSGK